MFPKKPASKRAIALTVLALLFATSLSSSAMAISLPLGGKKAALDLPTEDKLEEGLAPETPATDSGAAEKKTVELAPLRLNDDVQVKDDGGTVLKDRAVLNDFVPKGPEGGTEAGGLPTKSIKAEKSEKGDKKGGKISKALNVKKDLNATAKDVNVQPLALMDSGQEVQQKAELLENNEQKQIADLWESTLEKSPDIQFVVQKLVPTTDKGHATHVMMKMLSSVMFGAVSMAGMASPNQGTYMLQNTAYSVLNQLNGVMDQKQLGKMQLNQAELISLYTIVRNTADKLVEDYRLYKKNFVGIARCSTDLEDLRNMVASARQGQDAAKQIEMEYTLRKAQRDIDDKAEDVHRFRQQLMDMAGAAAVDKLDGQINEEMQQLDDSKIANKKESKSKDM